VCDDLCVGTVTTLASVTPATQVAGSSVALAGSGFGPSLKVAIGSTLLTPQPVSGSLVVQIPADFSPLGPHPVRVVNPEGCQSQELVSLTVTGSSACGLTGGEPLLLLAALSARRRLRRLCGSARAP
jgi:hypothetical protein